MFGSTGGEQQFDFNASIPQGTFGMPQEQAFGFGGPGVGVMPNEDYATSQWGTEGIQSTLAGLFNGAQGAGMGSNGLKLLAALAEGQQNKRKASNVQNIVNQQQARTDPFGSQRPFYQQQLQNTVQDPYSQPIVKSQVDQIARAQAIKDAAAGRRSNSATSSPAMLAAQAAVAQKYMDSLQTPAGANISPNASGLDQLIAGSNAGVNGYVSPIMSALGYGTQSNSTQAQLAAIQQLLANAKGA